MELTRVGLQRDNIQNCKKKKLYPTIMKIINKGREKVNYTCSETDTGNWHFKVQA